MPVSISKNKNGTYKVKTPSAVHAKSTTKAKAERQKRLINAVDHGWKPTGKKSKRSESLSRLVDRVVNESTLSDLPDRVNNVPGLSSRQSVEFLNSTGLVAELSSDGGILVAHGKGPDAHQALKGFMQGRVTTVESKLAECAVGDWVIVKTHNLRFHGAKGKVTSLGQDGNFLVVEIAGTGRQSFQASDVEKIEDPAEHDDLEEDCNGAVDQLVAAVEPELEQAFQDDEVDPYDSVYELCLNKANELGLAQSDVVAGLACKKLGYFPDRSAGIHFQTAPLSAESVQTIINQLVEDHEILSIPGKSSYNGRSFSHVVKIVRQDGRKPVVSIDKTPGQWYVDDFLNGSGPLAIDAGMGWTLTNADEIRKEVGSIS